LQSREDEYALGKSYLAKMMNLEAESMTDQDVKGALAYLFPSGLFDPAARPKLLEPDDLYETADILSVSSCGRPKHFMYYTGKAEYFSMMHNISVVVEELMSTPYEVARPPIDMSKHRILNKEELGEMFPNDKINIHDYKSFHNLMNRLTILPNSSQKTDFALQYCTEKASASAVRTLPAVAENPDENSLTVVAEGLKKHKRAHVTMTLSKKKCDNQEEEFVINGNDDLSIFDAITRVSVICPLIISGLLGRVKISATVSDGYMSSGVALRSALAQCAAALCQDEEKIEILRQSGLLTTDLRARERKKAGKQRARRAFPWRKR